MISTIGNESLTKTGRQAQKEIDDAREYLQHHMMSTPIEPKTDPRDIDLEHDPDALLYGH